ncbi:DNA/RNA non-specific endonuclease [Prevotella sp.]|uniref:DNA/RNA non-specific endonuclease n=1 Tax=Prevotella sp. TaxID=59823 RepID=UPI0027E344DE|nr:DNA/RNA non-specific endonuclease [Prevotella sp.]
MKLLHTLRPQSILYLCFACLTLFFASCGDDNNPVIDDGKPVNKNANVVTTDKAVLRLEFPALKKTGRQQVIVYRVSDHKKYDNDHVNYAVEWDCDKKSQRWSCYQMHLGYTGKYDRVTPNNNKYPQDPNIATEDRYDDVIYRSGFDHGHICPNADRKYSYDANYQTFYMSNMQPQYSKFNGFSDDRKNYGLWARMEIQLRKWVDNLGPKDTIFVCKGGTIDDEKNIIKRIDGKLIVPKYFFTAVLRKYYINGKHKYIALGYWCDQTNSYRTNETIKQHCMSIEKLEQLTGIDFFCNLPDDIEANVEKNYNESSWKWL